jgi:hypothetical protein
MNLARMIRITQWEYIVHLPIRFHVVMHDYAVVAIMMQRPDRSLARQVRLRNLQPELGARHIQPHFLKHGRHAIRTNGLRLDRRRLLLTCPAFFP